jgi:hypothetical protein
LKISVVNLSLGAPSGDQTGTDAVSIKVNQLVAAGVFVAVAAGNFGDAPSTIYSPGTAFYATTVGSAVVNRYGSYLSYFSSQGPLPGGPGVDFLAAGTSIRAAKSTANNQWAGTSVVYSGTSMAAPYVAGLAALLHQKNPLHAPSGTICTPGSGCPLGVIPATMTNGLEGDISASDWFAPGVDPISGHGLVSASNSLAGVATPPAAHAETTFQASTPTMIEIPAHAQPVTVSIVTAPSFPATGTGNDLLDYSWLDASGASSAVTFPCNVTILGSDYYCDISPINGDTVLTQRSWYFASPPNTSTSWLRLLPTQSGSVKVSVAGIGAGLAVTGGLKADDVTLNGGGGATVTVQRTIASGTSTALTIRATGGIDAPASVTLPAGAAGTTATFAVAESSGFAPVAPNTAARVALSAGSSLVLDVSVRFGSPEAATPGQITVAGDQILSGDYAATTLAVSSNGTVLGDSNQDALVRFPSTSGYYTGPFVVEPGSNDAHAIPIHQTTVSSIYALDVSGDGNRVLLVEGSTGAGIVSGDTDNRLVTFVHNRTTHASVQIGSPTIAPVIDATTRPMISEDGTAVAFVAIGAGGTHDVWWQGGTNFGTMTKIVSQSSTDDVAITGVSASRVLFEYRSTGELDASLKLYLASTQALKGQWGILPGTSTLSADDWAVAYVTTGNLGVCTPTSGGGITQFALAGHVPLGPVTAGSNCATLKGTFERVAAFPTGWQGAQLASIAPSGTRTVLAESARDDVRWVTDRGANQVLTVSGIAFGAGDTNGLIDVYRGALGEVGPTVTAATPTIAGPPAVGGTLTASAGAWQPSPVMLAYQWLRQGVAIVGAHESTYAPGAADVGKTLSVTVTGSRDGYFSQSATSGPTIPIAASVAAVLPAVSRVSQGYGPLAGGTVVTLTGVRFTGATQVTFAGKLGTGLTVADDSHLTVTTPAGDSAQAPVVVTNAYGDSPTAGPAFFAYLAGSVVAESPVRILDTSSFMSGAVRCYPVVGLATVPDRATAVLLNVTTVSPSGNGYVVIYPDTAGNGATPAPLSSTVNFEPGRDVANSAIVALPSDGNVCAYSAGGMLSRLILDVAGYIVPGSGITVQSAQRLLDTRQVAQQVTGPVPPSTVENVQVTGNAGVPAGATAVVANVTVVGPTAEGHLRVWAQGKTVPNTSVVNYAPGQTKANGQIIALSPSGGLSFESFTGTGTRANPVQVIIDVVGYVAAGSQFTATAPTRIVETRATSGIVGPIPGALVPNTVYPVTLSDTALIPSSATAVVLNVTAVGPTEFGNLRVYPDTNGLGTTAPPNSSVINHIPGRAIPNMVIVQISTDHRTIDFYNNQGLSSSRTHLIVDVIGYISGNPD